jgi:hypothetical protein
VELNVKDGSNMSKELIKEKIEYIKYCHSTMDSSKSTIYQRASILMAIEAFMIPSCTPVILNVLSKNSLSDTIYHFIFIPLSILFFLSFMYIIFWCFKCLIPVKNWPSKQSNQMEFTTFEKICDLGERSDFDDKVNELDNGKILEQLTTATYNVSHFLEKRYKDLRYALRGLYINIPAFVFIILIYGYYRD